MIKYHHLQIVEFGLRTCALVEETGGGVAGAGVGLGLWNAGGPRTRELEPWGNGTEERSTLGTYIRSDGQTNGGTEIPKKEDEAFQMDYDFTTPF